MAKVILTKEARLADRILRFLNVYPKTFPEFIKMLDLAGYEIREKGEP